MFKKIMQKSKKPSHLKDLVLLFAIPTGIAIFAAAIIYTPRLLANPKSDFMYSLCNNYDCIDSYTVDSTGHVSKEFTNSTHSAYFGGTSIIRYYDASSDSTKSLPLEEARTYRLNTSSKSSDGYSLTREETGSGFLFWGDYDEGWYLVNGGKKRKVELSSNGSHYSQEVKFLGWVEK